MPMFVYRVHVSMRGEDNVHVFKDIVRCRIVKMGRDYLHINAFPESYGDHGTIKVPKGDCFTELSDAQSEADGRANELVAKLVMAAKELREPAKVLDKVNEIEERQ